MTLHAPYDEDNIFAKILRGEMPHVSVFEDDIALALMDVFPQVEGHTLIIPKRVQARNFLDMPTEHVGPYMERVQMVARAVEKALSPDGVVVTQFNGAPAGQTVFHLHFHILPRFQGEKIGSHATGQMATPDVLEPIAAKIRAHIV